MIRYIKTNIFLKLMDENEKPKCYSIIYLENHEPGFIMNYKPFTSILNRNVYECRVLSYNDMIYYMRCINVSKHLLDKINEKNLNEVTSYLQELCDISRQTFIGNNVFMLSCLMMILKIINDYHYKISFKEYKCLLQKHIETYKYYSDEHIKYIKDILIFKANN